MSKFKMYDIVCGVERPYRGDVFIFLLQTGEYATLLCLDSFQEEKINNGNCTVFEMTQKLLESDEYGGDGFAYRTINIADLQRKMSDN